MSVKKIVGSVEEAIAGVKSGMTVLVGGFGGAGTPHHLLQAMLKAGLKDLTAVAIGYTQVWDFIEQRRLKKLVTAFPTPWDAKQQAIFEEQWRSGSLQVELMPQGTLAERIRAAGAGIGAFYTTVGVGTFIAEGKERRTIDGKEYLLERPLKADVAVIKAYKADEMGNLVYRRSARTVNPIMATAADLTIAEVEEVVPAGALDPEHIVTPGIYVDRVVQVKSDTVWKYPGKPTTAQGKQGIGLTRELMALRAIKEFRPGEVVNLGMGLPALASNFMDYESGVILHAENGILGYGPIAEREQADKDLVNASGNPVTLLPGACFMHHADSFALVHSGKLDIALLGAFQVSEKGDLANSAHPGRTLGGLGGAMDIATCAKRLVVLMEHTGGKGEKKILKRCTYQVTAKECVDRIITNLGVIDVTPQGLVLQEIAPDVTVEQVQELTEPKLTIARDLKVIEL